MAFQPYAVHNSTSHSCQTKYIKIVHSYIKHTSAVQVSQGCLCILPPFLTQSKLGSHLVGQLASYSEYFSFCYPFLD